MPFRQRYYLPVVVDWRHFLAQQFRRRDPISEPSRQIDRRKGHMRRLPVRRRNVVCRPDVEARLEAERHLALEGDQPACSSDPCGFGIVGQDHASPTRSLAKRGHGTAQIEASRRI